MHKIRMLLRLPWTLRLMLAEAFLLSGWYRFRILYRPFAELAAHMGQPGLETDDHVASSPTISHIAWAVPAICKRTPWQSKCFVQALTARYMLTRRGLSCTLYMGARRTEQGQMQAHAWLRCGSVFVVGGNGQTDFAVTSIYGTPGRNT